MITGARSRGFREIGIDAGALIENFKDIYDLPTATHDSIIDSLVTELDSDNCLGITRGGSHFVSEAEMRQIEFDGQRVRFKGDAIKGGANPTIETTLLEFSLANLKRIIPSSDVVTIGGKTVIRERLRIDDSDYMKSISWVRERKDGSIIIVTLFNPMNVGNVDIPGEDNNEAAIPVTFTGFNDDFTDLANAPYEIAIFSADDGSLSEIAEQFQAEMKSANAKLLEAQGAVSVVQAKVRAAEAQAVAQAKTDAANMTMPKATGRTSGSKYSAITEG